MPEKPTLVIVDVQKAFDDPAWGKRNNPARKGTSPGCSRHGGPRTRRSSTFGGFETWFVGDACATFDREGPDGEFFPADLMHRTALASLHDEFADVVSTDEAIARLG